MNLFSEFRVFLSSAHLSGSSSTLIVTRATIATSTTLEASLKMTMKTSNAVQEAELGNTIESAGIDWRTRKRTVPMRVLALGMPRTATACEQSRPYRTSPTSTTLPN